MQRILGRTRLGVFSLGKGALSLILVALAISAASLAVDREAIFGSTEVGDGCDHFGGGRNVILLIGDGMADSDITLARNYYVGGDGQLAMDSLPCTGAVKTHTVQEANPSQPDYVAASEAAASAIATGRKTASPRISTSPGTDQDVTTILELAQGQGLRTGIVTTADITDATPAAFASHVNNRNCRGPLNMAPCPQDLKSASGPGSIAEQLVDHHVDVLLGGGMSRYTQVIPAGEGPYAGSTVLTSATGQGYTVVTDATQLSGVQPGGRVLGLFANGDMTREWTGAPALAFPGSGPQVCATANRPASQPALATMATKALQLLSASNSSSDSGFFLMVEGASIDKAAHFSDPCGQIGETVAFDAAIQVALNFARQTPRDTLVIVVGDHGHSAQIIEPPTNPAQPGAFSTLITVEGVEMTVSYATAPVGGFQGHTGTQLKVAAFGPGADVLLGVHHQTEIFNVMLGILLDSD